LVSLRGSNFIVGELPRGVLLQLRLHHWKVQPIAAGSAHYHRYCCHHELCCALHRVCVPVPLLSVLLLPSSAIRLVKHRYIYHTTPKSIMYIARCNIFIIAPLALSLILITS
jgi:hypothetical protein